MMYPRPRKIFFDWLSSSLSVTITRVPYPFLPMSFSMDRKPHSKSTRDAILYAAGGFQGTTPRTTQLQSTNLDHDPIVGPSS